MYGMRATVPENTDMPNKYVFSALPLRFLAMGKKYSKSNVKPPSAYPNPTNNEYTGPVRMALVAKDVIVAIAVTLPNFPVSLARVSMRNQPITRCITPCCWVVWLITGPR
jgi:hypothetical protein